MSYTRDLAELKKTLGELIEEAPELQSFAGFVESAEATDAIDNRTKELMSLAVAVAVRCEDCILWHTDAALEAGASHEEVVDALKVAVAMGGGPAMTYAVKAYGVLEAFEAERAE
ncbi:MAG: carboxymuconolactone decarboxylase family protein [Halorubrum sp.]|uniref:carboxymuconolactone decarboxylase family protein n=1 Tax=Halorubrum sp. TaxID=1879286 RepID=UPI003971069F